MLRHKTGEGTDGGKPLVTGRDFTATRGLKIGEESAGEIGREIDDSETIDGLLLYLCDKWDEQAECVAVAVLGIAGEIAFSDDMFQQKATNPWAKRGVLTHEKTPWRIVRIGHSLRVAALVSGRDSAVSPGH